jgi:arylsulfatase A-like enzyme
MIHAFAGAIALCVFASTSAAAGALSPPVAAFQDQGMAPPNVVFILVDDLGFMDVSPNNPDTFYDTPNIQRLADGGTRFTNAYASCPVCSPTRSSIMTGKYPARTGITDYINEGRFNQPEKWKRKTALLPAEYTDRLAHEEITLAEALKANGYATFFAGKWHLGPEGFWPEDHGFDVNKGGITRGGPYGGKKYFSPYGNPRLDDGPDGEHLPQRLANETAAFIRENQDQPFFAFLSFYSVHTPLIAREDLKQKYLKKRDAGPDEAWGKEGERRVRMVQNHAVYAGMVEAMDMAVGTVMDALAETGADKNTVVIFTSDNGGLSTSEGSPTSNLPLRAGKGWLYEGGIREPLIVRLPEGMTSTDLSVKQKSVCDAVVTSTDFYPTILNLVGIQSTPEQHVDGKSFVGPLLGHDQDQRGPVFWHYPHYGNQGGQPGAAVREGDWKLIEWFDQDRVELYRLDVDPGEQFDLATQHQAKRDELLTQLHDWQKEIGAKMPTINGESKINQLRWMAGHWRASHKGNVKEEGWFAPRNGVMVGTHRDCNAEGGSSLEHLEIVERDGLVIYRAFPSNQEPAEFTLQTLEPRRAIFVNEDHDFPTHIEYIRENDQLTAKVSGTVNGVLRVVTWKWTLMP